MGVRRPSPGSDLVNVWALIGVLAVGLVIGGAAVWFWSRTRLLLFSARLDQLQGDLVQAREGLDEGRRNLAEKSLAASEVQVELARLKSDLEHERRVSAEKLSVLEQAKTVFADAFTALSANALKSNNQAFLELARTTLEKFQAEAKGDLELKQQAVQNLVAPIKIVLDQVMAQIDGLEKARREAYAGLREQVKSLVVSQDKLQLETSNLVKALRRPQVRGRWGEIQLRRVVEMAGMLPHCDFVEQPSLDTEEGRLRPDLIVQLPGGKNVVVDAKAPLEAYLDAVEAEDEIGKQKHLRKHAQQIKGHVAQLSSKKYWSQFDSTPDFVVMFLPGESILSAAVEQDPTVIETGFSQKVLLASPTLLIALLKSVAYGWQQERVAESAQKISQLGREIYDRLSVLSSHFNQLGRHLDRSMEAYNRAVGSLEGRVLVSARRFVDLGVGSEKEIESPQVIERSVRRIEHPELVNPLPAQDPSDDED